MYVSESTGTQNVACSSRCKPRFLTSISRYLKMCVLNHSVWSQMIIEKTCLQRLQEAITSSKDSVSQTSLNLLLGGEGTTITFASNQETFYCYMKYIFFAFGKHYEGFPCFHICNEHLFLCQSSFFRPPYKQKDCHMRF